MTKKLYLPLLMAMVVALFSSCSKKMFPAESYRRIEKRLLENNLIYKYPKGKGNFRLNYVWKDMYASKVLK